MLKSASGGISTDPRVRLAYTQTKLAYPAYQAKTTYALPDDPIRGWLR